MINFVVYSHSSYSDILQIQTDYITKDSDVILLIDKNDIISDSVYGKYKKVIFYDSNDTYPVRLLKSISQINSDYILLIHDIDILIKYDENILTSFQQFLIENNFDRVDLKYTDKINYNSKIINVDLSQKVSEWKIINKSEIGDNIVLVEQNDINNYIYNVNPSIWKKNSLIKILEKFPYKNYRTIEEIDVQQFAKDFKVFKMFSNEKLNCGYFQCLPLFVFLHISHNGKLLSLNDNFKTIYGQSYSNVSQEYIKIVENYNLKKSKKWIN